MPIFVKLETSSFRDVWNNVCQTDGQTDRGQRTLSDGNISLLELDPLLFEMLEIMYVRQTDKRTEGNGH